MTVFEIAVVLVLFGRFTTPATKTRRRGPRFFFHKELRADRATVVSLARSRWSSR
jgi:hypothetical protein